MPPPQSQIVKLYRSRFKLSLSSHLSFFGSLCSSVSLALSHPTSGGATTIVIKSLVLTTQVTMTLVITRIVIKLLVLTTQVTMTLVVIDNNVN